MNRVKFWETIGLLYGIVDYKKQKCSKLFDRTIKYMVKNNCSSQIINMVFAIIIRLVRNLSLNNCNKIDIKYLCDNLDNKKEFFYRNNKDNKNMDIEVAFCASYVGEYINDIIKKVK